MIPMFSVDSGISLGAFRSLVWIPVFPWVVPVFRLDSGISLG